MSITHKISPILGYHGCEREVAEKVLAGKTHLNTSENLYDWLGSGIYFWVDSFARTIRWAEENPKIETPYAIGAFIDAGHCLNLTDYGVSRQIRDAYKLFAITCEQAGQYLPVNSYSRDGVTLARRLDCAVINYLHALRDKAGIAPYDTVYGVFEEGPPIFPDSALKEKTHVQIAVRNLDTIKGYFRPRELCESD